ncbi:MAG: FHA domain-containing protein [Clostridium sp.]|nr:FHA domain-containing protein [Clostridium sp.]
MEYRKEGMQNYMVISCPKECTENYEGMLMQYHEVPYIVPYEVREVNERCELYYRLRYRTTLRSVMGHLPFTMRRLYNMIASVVAVLETAEEFLFDAGHILWNPDYIFIEADTGKLQFCSYPEMQKDEIPLKKLLAEWIEQTDKKDEAAIMYLLKFYNLVTEPDCSLENLQAFLREAGKKQEYSEYEAKRTINQRMETAQKPEADRKTEKAESPQETFLWGVEEKSENEETSEEGYAEKIVKWMLIITALLNLVIIGLLLFNILTYGYVKYLLVTMAAMIVLTIFYMNLSKEETPDEMMQAYFEENKVKREDKAQARLAYAGIPNGDYESEKDAKGMNVEYVNRPKTERYGETTVLTSEEILQETKSAIVQEDYGHKLILSPIVPGSYLPVHIENSIVIGCMEEGCNYLLKQRGISRMHAKLMYKPDGLYLLDLNSTNGTYLNGELLASGEEYRLEEGDMVAFAQCEFYVVKSVTAL